ncbi:MAG: OmpA family protein [Akkermansiaceae bacterium]
MDNQDTQNTPQNSAPTQNAPARAGGNQLTTALIVIIVVLLFVMLLFTMNGNMFQSQAAPGNDVTALKSRNTQLRAEINAERASRGLPPLPEDASTARSMAERIQRDATSLAAMTSQWQTELEKKDEALRAREGEIAGHTQNAQRLYAQITALQAKLDQEAGAATELVRLNNDLKIAQNQIAAYQKQLTEFQGRPTSEEQIRLRKQLNESIDAQNKLQLQVDKLTAEARSKVDKKEYDDLAAELAQLRPKLRLQHYEIQSLRAKFDRAKLFIESAIDLPTEAAKLFARLKTLESVNEQQLKAAYTNIEATIGARIIHRQSFATGSSQITFDRESILRDIVSKSGDTNAYFLVVGYASKSGGKEQNKKLSSERATTVASVVNVLRATGQDVKAVYLGETDRFSKNDEMANQICEVWEIKR